MTSSFDGIGRVKSSETLDFFENIRVNRFSGGVESLVNLAIALREGGIVRLVNCEICDPISD